LKVEVLSAVCLGNLEKFYKLHSKIRPGKCELYKHIDEIFYERDEGIEYCKICYKVFRIGKRWLRIGGDKHIRCINLLSSKS